MEKTKHRQRLSFAELVPLGYVYLILLGMTSDSLFFGLLGINIMQYSTILDVLLSPVVVISGSPVVLAGVLLPVFLLYPYLRFVYWLQARKNGGKPSGFLAKHPLGVVWLGMSVVVLFSSFVGVGVGSGLRVRQLIADQAFRHDHEVRYADGTREELRVIGVNGSYLFAIFEGETRISVIPISQNITRLRELDG